MKRVFSSPSPVEAHLVQGFLAQAGISAAVQGGELGGLLGAVPTSETFASVWVADDQLGQAADLVEEFLRSEPAAAGATLWRCPGCGEYLEPQFSDCWSCGASRIAPSPASSEAETEHP